MNPTGGMSDNSQLRKVLNRFGVRAPPSFLLANLEKLSTNIVALARALNCEVVAIGHDSTVEATKIADAFLIDITKFGLHIHHLNELSAPEISFATQSSDILGIYITGSHEAPDICGVKFFARGSQLVGTNLVPLMRLLDSSKSARFQPRDYSRMLHKMVTRGVCNLTVRKIAVANSTSAGGKVLCRCLSALGHTILELGPLNQTVPRPWEEKYASLWTKSQLTRLTQAVKNGEADLGLVIDEDGDRVVLALPEQGLVPCDEMGAILTQIWIAPNNKVHRIVCDYRASPGTLEFIRNCETEVILCEVGRDTIVNCMLSTASYFGFEMSGHFFFKEPTAVRADAILAAAILVSSNDLERVYSSVREASHFRWRAGEFRLRTQAINAQKLALDSTLAIRNGIAAKLSHYSSGIICIIPQRTYLVVRRSHNGRELSVMIWATDLDCLNKILGAMKALVRMEK